MLHLLATCLLLTSTVGIADDTWWSCQPLTQPNIPGDESDGHPIDRFLAVFECRTWTAGPADPRIRN